jgi:hypothetical protein
MSSARPFKKFFCDRKETFAMPPNAFKVWMYHYCLEGEDRKSWPSRDNICKTLRISVDTLKITRQWLTDNGWLVKVGERNSRGEFSIPVFKVRRGIVPPVVEKYRGGKKPVHRGENSATVAGGKTTPEVDTKKQVDTEVEEIEMSLKNNITDKCRLILGIRINPNAADWKEIASLARIHDSHKVLEAFEKWANSKRGENIAYPLSKFVDVADGLLTGIIQLSEDTEFNDFCGGLYDVGNQAFTGKYRVVLKELVKRHGQKEVSDSYREFCGNLDEYHLRSVVRDFCDGGADSVISARAKRRKEIEQVSQMGSKITEELQIQAAKEKAESIRRKAAEASLIEDTLE